MIKACIFDLDGTLADTLPSIAYFGNEALKTFGLPEIEQEKYRWLVGNGAEALVRRMLKLSGDPDMRLFEPVCNYYRQMYDENYLYLTKPYAGIMQLLKALKGQGMMLGVLSNKPHITSIKVVESLFGRKLIDRCYGQRSGAPLKPDPSALHDLQNEFQVNPTECLYIGDTGVDMDTGHNACTKTIGVLWGFRDRQELIKHKADWVIESPADILSIVATING